jgi:hypothetical protein
MMVGSTSYQALDEQFLDPLAVNFDNAPSIIAQELMAELKLLPADPIVRAFQLRRHSRQGFDRSTSTRRRTRPFLELLPFFDEVNRIGGRRIVTRSKF